MISNNIVRDSENILSTRHKLLESERKGVLKPKTNALGDVQNTLHSRPNNPNNSSVKSTIQSKVNAFSKFIVGENTPSGKPRKNINHETSDLVHASNIMDNSCVLETHNHVLCEQAEQSSDFFLQYKFDLSDIERLTKSVKRFKLEMPQLQYQYICPCADIEIPKEREYGDNECFINDLSDEFELPDIPPPIEVL